MDRLIQRNVIALSGRAIAAAGDVDVLLLDKTGTITLGNREADKIEALNAGADDYLTKPFGVGELLARIQVVMRRVLAAGTGHIYQARDLNLDMSRHQVTLNGQELPLTPTEFDLLRVLIQNAGKVVTHRQIIHQVWGTPLEDESRLLRVNISNLRRKLEPDPNHPQYLLTELGVGYRLKDS